ncbi:MULTISPECIES: class I SAM-dependent methyltransferase [unclassified Corallococcus]|uniref:class I SAM-dependent methyltransferase n=1 Tax=unclassified Corallococcus TaxID=2685029 RepID=UPI001A8D5ACE|nr:MULTISPECIES: class I SAM-dependent methyltransferase [unclassified Corallococcus]MBN9682352.1 class I SAM-dependent methyltransferase [Corallococcus sp. NCSPR001]WAS86096.1 class I SAM-dependent methyltransferase [Corallococcus sp. NCRR]
MPSPSESYLLDFHARLAGVTSKWFGQAPVRWDGETAPSTYALLEAVVPLDARPLAVLDLACGDGYLLELLARRKQPGLYLLGLDMSEHELVAARTRLNGAATLFQGRAQSLPFGDASVDVVLSHLALMLMDDVETVLAELRRVLKPGGRVSIVVGGDLVSGNALEVFAGFMKNAAAVPPTRLGDARVRSADGLRTLFAKGFVDVTVRSLSVQGDGSPSEVWESLLTTYDADRLSPAAQASLKASFTQAVEPLRRSDGSVPLRWGMRQLTAIRTP